MFPEVFYPSAYFPIAYWPKVGAAPPPAPRTLPQVTGSADTTFPVTGSLDMADTFQLACFRGEDVAIPFRIRNQPGGIQGWALSAVLKPNTSPATAALATLTVGSGITIDAGTAATGTMTLAAADTTQPTATYVLDLARTDSGEHAVLTTIQLLIQPDTVFP